MLIHIFHYLYSRLSGLFTQVPTSLDNQGLTEMLFLVDKFTDYNKYFADFIEISSRMRQNFILKNNFRLSRHLNVLVQKNKPSQVLLL